MDRSALINSCIDWSLVIGYAYLDARRGEFCAKPVYYIDRAYRIPDYGIWARGGKMNFGQAELCASSIGMAKAALEALTGFNLFRPRGSQASVIHVIPDNIACADSTLHAMLPCESSSKESCQDCERVMALRCRKLVK